MKIGPVSERFINEYFIGLLIETHRKKLFIIIIMNYYLNIRVSFLGILNYENIQVEFRGHLRNRSSKNRPNHSFSYVYFCLFYNCVIRYYFNNIIII